MDAIMMDTLKAARGLEAAGMERAVAEAMALATAAIIEAVREDAAAFDASPVLGELEAAGLERRKAEAFVEVTAALVRGSQDGATAAAGPEAGSPNPG